MSGHYTPIFAGGRLIGKVQGDTFYKSIRKNHYLRRPPAIAFDIESLDQAEQAGADKVQVTDREDGTTYISTIEHIRTRGNVFNRGYGDQIYLVLDGWIKQKPGGRLQMSLFGGAA
jgi:hypothetical protein